MNKEVFINCYQYAIECFCSGYESEVCFEKAIDFSNDNITDYQEIINMAWRMMSSNLIEIKGCSTDEILSALVSSYNLEGKLITSLDDREESWRAFSFTAVSLKKIREIADKANMLPYNPDNDEIFNEKLYKELSEIFNDHGVGFDKKCPYKIGKK